MTENRTKKQPAEKAGRRIFEDRDRASRILCDTVMADFKKNGFSGVIAKPYELTELGQILQQVLGHDK